MNYPKNGIKETSVCLLGRSVNAGEHCANLPTTRRNHCCNFCL